MSSEKASNLITSGPQASVPKDPQPSVDRIEELAVRILKGDILLPKFQRDFVWEKKKIIDLLDSVSRGYPIGSVLLWQSRQELRSENRIADLEIDLPKPDYPVNYLLDGQQRLSTICGALFWQGNDPKSKWNIAYDLRLRKFVHLDTLDDPPQHQVRVNKLADGAEYYKQISTLHTLTAKDVQQLKDHADDLFNRFKNYKIASVTLGDMSIDDVAPIFERINSTGTPLTIVDLMRAATWSPDFDLIDSIDSVLSSVADKDFDAIDRKVVLRSLSAAVGGGFSAEKIDDLRHKDVPSLKSAIASVRESYKRTVDFLSTEIGVSSSGVLPYLNQMAVLGEIFRRVPVPNANQHRAIVDWFWATSLSGYFGGWNTGMMAADLEAIIQFSTGKADTIAGPALIKSTDIWMRSSFRANTAYSKLLAIVLAHHSPQDLLSGQKIDIATALAWNNTKEFHHFFPQQYLKSRNVSASKINALANIVMLTSASNKTISKKPPSEYLKAVSDAAGNNLKQWLASNLISEAAYSAACEDRFDDFLVERSKSINEAVTKLISREKASVV